MRNWGDQSQDQALIHRRGFLEVGAGVAAAGAVMGSTQLAGAQAVAGKKASEKLLTKRTLGRTGVEVSMF